jgi:hypothetical protein
VFFVERPLGLDDPVGATGYPEAVDLSSATVFDYRSTTSVSEKEVA